MWPAWLSPPPKVGRRTLGECLCAKVRVLLLVSGSTSDVCKSPMAGCIRVSLTSAGTGFSVGGSDVAELWAGMQAGHVGVLSGPGQVELSITHALT